MSPQRKASQQPRPVPFGGIHARTELERAVSLEFAKADMAKTERALEDDAVEQRKREMTRGVIPQ